ncbi:MAG: hypothetical protein COA42_04630 [Alteromonadaceae bacterium]|nr:MAG: hypothetical protein COA42_04630 [Alteromonadaceae bacterium]
MKIGISVLFSLVLLMSQQVFAHGGGHAHGPVTEAQAFTIAADAAMQLTVNDIGLAIGKLPASWASVPVEQMSMYKKDKAYYIVALINTSEKKTLYILMAPDGGTYDANFSGVFEGLK